MIDKENNTTDKIKALRDMIYNAEKTLHGAKAMLLQLEGKKKVGRKKKTVEEIEEGRVIEGTFDGQIMLGTDGKQYPVPSNYASKSKLVEGDMLKLTITPDGSFIYKQIGPVDRKRLIGMVNTDADGNYFIIAEGKAFKVLLASITYFKVEPGDEVTLVIPNDLDSDWASIENVLQKGRDHNLSNPETTAKPKIRSIDDIIGDKEEAEFEEKEEEPVAPKETPPQEEIQPKNDLSILDEWTPDIEELKRELRDGDNK